MNTPLVHWKASDYIRYVMEIFLEVFSGMLVNTLDRYSVLFSWIKLTEFYYE